MTDLTVIDELIATARAAQKAYEAGATQERFDRAAEAVAWALMEPGRNEALSHFAVAETAMWKKRRRRAYRSICVPKVWWPRLCHRQTRSRHLSIMR